MADWSMLPDHAVVLIARRLELIEDFVAFRRTCTSWRMATSLKDFDRSCPRLPLLMLKPPDGFDSNINTDEREFYSLYSRKTCKIKLPETREMSHCLGSKGWIIMVRYEDDMALLHPITRVQILLPSHPKRCYPFHTAVLSASPSETTEYALMIVYKSWGKNNQDVGYMAFWKPGDVTWTEVEVPENSCWVDHVCYYNGKFYALVSPSQVLVYDVFGPNPTKASIIIDLPWDFSRPCPHLVECAGRLLVIAPNYEDTCGTPLDDLEMVELDVIKGTYTNVTSLGNSTVFLGFDDGFSVDATGFPMVIKPNYIYFSSNGSFQIARCGHMSGRRRHRRHMTGGHQHPHNLTAGHQRQMQVYDINGSHEIFHGVWINL